MKNWFLFFFVILLSDVAFSQVIVDGTSVVISSPDKNLTIQFYQKQDVNNNRTLFYSIHYKNKQIINESSFDLQLDNHLSESAMALKIDTHKRWMENLKVNRIITLSKDTSWQPVVGEKKIIHGLSRWSQG